MKRCVEITLNIVCILILISVFVFQMLARLSNPQLTETQLLTTYWREWCAYIACVFALIVAAFLIEKAPGAGGEQ